jgi:hypothetical protein
MNTPSLTRLAFSTLSAIAALASGGPMATGLAADQAAAVFTLKDHLNRDWTNELVVFAVEKGIFGRNDLVLVGPEGKPVVYQWVPARQAASGKDSIAFAASVRRFGTSVSRLVPRSPAKETDLRIGLSDGGVQAENGLIGVRLGGSTTTTRS